jgi:hypothetical protein
VLVFGQISKAEENNPYVKAVSPILEKVMAFPQAEFSLPEPKLFELQGDYSEFAAGALAKELLDTLQDNQQVYFNLDFPQWLEANEALFELDDHVSVNAEYGNALIKSYLNSLWLTSGYRWLMGNMLDKQRDQGFDISQFIQQWQRVRFHLIDLEAVNYLYYKDITKINWKYMPPPHPLENQLKKRSLNANLELYKTQEIGLTSKLFRESKNLSEQFIKKNKDFFASEELYQKLLTNKYFRAEHIQRLRNNEFLKKNQMIVKRYNMQEKESLKLISFNLVVPQYLMILNALERSSDTGKLFERYINLLIKAKLLKDQGLSFQGWALLDYRAYLKHCRPDPWCPPDDLARMEKGKRVLKYETLLGTETVNYFGLIALSERLSKTYPKIK